MMKSPVRSIRGLRIVGITLLAIFLSVGQAAGQSRQSGEIRGTVTDQSGAVIPGVAVTITNISTGVTQRETTDPTGLYEAPSVPLGEYAISFVKEGFKQFVRSGIVLLLETITVNAQLQVGTTSQSINVTAPVPLVETENAEESTALTSTALTSIPDVGRNWYNFVGLLPGVNSGGGSGLITGSGGQNAGVNGQGGLEANWQVDGGRGFLAVSSNPDWMSPPLDDIQEVKLLTSNFGAEYGNGLSVFNVVTKSGSDRFHGNAFEYVENDILNAKNYFAPSKLPFRWNEYGGTLGGPIRRDKAFFFFSYQRNPVFYHYPSYASFPTASMLEGNFSAAGLQTIYDPSTLSQVNGTWVRQPFAGNIIPQARFDPVAARIQQNFPGPNLPGLFNNHYWDANQPVPGQWVNAKVDYNITPTNRITGSVMIVRASIGIPAPDPSIDWSTWAIKEYQAQLTDVWTMSPHLVGEFRLSLSREHGLNSAASYGKGWPGKLGLNNLVSNMFPGSTIEGTLTTSIGTASGNEGGGVDCEEAYVPSAHFTWARGRHIIKFGGEFNRWWANVGWPMVDAGNFDYNGIFTRNPSDPASAGEGYADFLLGLPDTWSVGVNPPAAGRLWDEENFVQDEYKIRPNLTLTGGVRWVIQSGWGEQYNRIANFDPTLTNPATGTLGAMSFAGQQGGWTNLEDTHYHFFAPRVGFAWAPKNNWSIRGGYGIFSVLWTQYGYNLSNTGLGWGIQGFETSTDLIHPIFTLAQGPPLPVYPTAALRTGALLNGQNVSYYPPKLPMGYVQEYRLDIQHQLKGGVLLDAAYVGNRGLHMPPGFARDMNQVPSNLLGPGDAQSMRPYPQFANIADYNMGDFDNYSSFQFTVRKDLARGLMFGINYTWSHALDTMTATNTLSAPVVWQNAYNRKADYGSAAMDIRNTLNGSFVYQLPLGRGRRFLDRGGPVNAVLGGWELSSMFTVHSGIPFTPLMGTANLSGSLSGSWRPNRIASGTVPNPTVNEWFDPAAFVQPTPYTFGTSGRGILFGPGYKDMDFALNKSFPISKLGEAGSVLVKAEAFDTFNSANFGLPNAAIGTAAAGTINSALTNRLIQLGISLRF